MADLKWLRKDQGQSEEINMLFMMTLLNLSLIITSSHEKICSLKRELKD